MLSNNNARLNIMLACDNPFNHKEFLTRCSNSNVEPLSALEYAQKLGMVKCAEAMYPDLSLSEAYLNYINDNQSTLPVIPVVPESADTSATVVSSYSVYAKSTGCGSCGGGKVL